MLSSRYSLGREDVVEVLDLLLRSKEISVDRADLVHQARRRFSSGGADFADCLIERIAHAQGCRETFTFDVGAVKAAGMSLVA